jgi:hypothetical protein
MDREEVLRRLSEHRAEFERFGVKALSLFGSIARRDAGPASDVDILVEFDRPIALLGFVDLQGYLTRLLGNRVDSVTLDALNPKMRERVLAEAVHAHARGPR